MGSADGGAGGGGGWSALRAPGSVIGAAAGGAGLKPKRKGDCPAEGFGAGIGLSAAGKFGSAGAEGSGANFHSEAF